MPRNTSQVITCPRCGAEIPLTEALLSPFQKDWQKRWETESKQKFDAEKKKELEEADSTIKGLRGELKEKDQKLKESQGYERELRGRLKKVEDREQELDIEVARKIDDEKRKIGEQHRVELLEKDEQLKKMRAKIEELEKGTEQTSPQLKGDALQYELDRVLKTAFPHDNITVIKRGVKGADIIQEVKDEAIGTCGIILWESKNTRRWDDGWIEKLKSDQRDKNADIAVLASIAMPKDIQNFGMKQGAWVTCFSAACCLSDVLRFSLVQTANTRLELEDKDQKVAALHSYFSTPSFKQRIEPVVEALKSMYEELNHEKRAMESIWAQREKEIAKAVRGAAGLYGDIRGIMGGALLPQIENLQLPSATKA